MADQRANLVWTSFFGAGFFGPGLAERLAEVAGAVLACFTGPGFASAFGAGGVEGGIVTIAIGPAGSALPERAMRAGGGVCGAIGRGGLTCGAASSMRAVCGAAGGGTGLAAVGSLTFAAGFLSEIARAKSVPPTASAMSASVPISPCPTFFVMSAKVRRCASRVHATCMVRLTAGAR